MRDPHELTGWIVALFNNRDSLVNVRDDAAEEGCDSSITDELNDAIERIDAVVDRLYDRWRGERGS